MYSAEEHESGFVDNFIMKSSQERYNYMLGVKKRRKKLTSRFGNSLPVVKKWVIPFDGKMPTKDIYELLRKHGAPDVCYLISSDSSNDGKFLDLLYAIHEEESLFGAILSCIPGKLALVIGESGMTKYILKKEEV